MASIFRFDDNFVDQPKRNTVDLSFQNNITTNFGKLPVCFIKPVVPGESLRIKTTFGFRFMPMTFPVQTRMKASVNFFYVRNRNLWKDFPDFIGKTKQGLVPPYIKITETNRKQIETCQLGDFLGLPTEVFGTSYVLGPTVTPTVSFYNQGSFTTEKAFVEEHILDSIEDQVLIYLDDIVGRNDTYFNYLAYGCKTKIPSTIDRFFFRFLLAANVNTPEYSVDLLIFDSDTMEIVEHVKSIRDATLDGNSFRGYRFKTRQDLVRDKDYIFYMVPRYDFNITSSFVPYSATFRYEEVKEGSISVKDMPLSQLPWRSDSNPNGIPLSALPFRAYESIYNVFYRNPENNPLRINGVPEYNKWIRTNDGGAETNFYPVMYHNWEDDFLTTAVPSPQQGNAPLVGLSGTATVTLAHDDGTTTTATLDVDDNGQILAVNEQSGDDITTLSLMEAVNYGISINDFRNVNSFQRWLENNIRRGYKYKDQIKTHYGVSVRYDELDMPEFIGGVSENVLVNQISQTVPTEDSPLGDMAGQASVVGTSHDVEHYCDEHGFIIGILCVKPVANYSQLLPKYWNITDAFDYYFPEFGHIGMQPIKNWEVAPLQANLEGKLNGTFGYQRAWYDMIASTDEVHGLFRTNLRNFLINRTFDGTPELGAEFTVMDPEQLNEVFAVTENTDKIIGQVYFECSKKTPVPLYGIPKLE